MRKIKTFVRTFGLSATDFSYYQKLVGNGLKPFSTKFSFSVKYLYFLLFIITFIQTLKISFLIFSYAPKTPKLVNEAKLTIKNIYPEKLEITVKNGNVKSNMKEPYFIDFPKLLEKEDKLPLFKNINYPERFLTIDTKASIEDIKNYKTLVLLTKNAVVFQRENEENRLYFLDKVKNFNINKKTYEQFLAKFFSYLDYLPTLIWILGIAAFFILPFFASALILFSKMLYLLFASFILLIICRKLKKKLVFSQIYQLSIHGLTLPIVFSFVQNTFDVLIPYFPLYSIIFFIWMTIVLSKIKTDYSRILIAEKPQNF